MLKYKQLMWAGALLVLTAGAPVHAQDAVKDAEKFAGQIPSEITEVVTGGTWTEGETTGVFRGIVVTSPAGKDISQASVIVQWLTMDKSGAGKVVKSVSVKEVADKKLQNAFLALDAENENELTLIITSYDAQKDEDASMQVKFSAKGQYEIMPTPKEEPAIKEEPASADGAAEPAAADANKKK
jgi:hypothetical protein